MPPPAFEHASIAPCIALVEFVTPSSVAPCEFAEKIRVRFGSRLAPTSLTHEGKPFVPLGKLACAEAAGATFEADVSTKNQINAERSLRVLFVINSIPFDNELIRTGSDSDRVPV